MSTEPTGEVEPLTTEQQMAAHRRWDALAILLGYNELAKLGKTLGEKIYARMKRAAAEEYFVSLGGNRDVFAHGPTILTLPEAPPSVVFRTEDIELMRACVAEHDARAADEKTVAGGAE